MAIPDIDPATATETEKLAWCKARAAAEPWTVAVGSIIQDMRLMGIPLKADTMALMMADAMNGGERSLRDFIDGLTLGSIDREAADHG